MNTETFDQDVVTEGIIHQDAVNQDTVDQDAVSQDTENYLATLAERMDEMIAICEQLVLENQSLHARHQSLLTERDTLSEDNEQLKARIGVIVARLKGLGQAYE